MDRLCIDCSERPPWVKKLCRTCYYRRWRAEHPGYNAEWKRAHPEAVAEYRARERERRS